MKVIDKKIRVLISAYACEPNKGSEPGVGWNWSKQIAKFAEAWVITRANNRKNIEDELQKNPEPHLHIVYVDLPRWLRFWKKGQRGVHLYYYLWQLAAYLKVRVLRETVNFDIVHHITFVNDWIPSFLAMLSVPFVWGPIGSHPPTPKLFLPNFQSKILEFLRITVQRIFRYLDPFFLVTLFRAKAVIMINNRLCDKYRFKLRPKSKFFYQSASGIDIDNSLLSYRGKGVDKLMVISVGRLIYFKGFHLTLMAFAELLSKSNNKELNIIGDGMLRSMLQSLAAKIGLTDHVEFLGNIARDDVLKRMTKSDIFLFPSFEGGGMVVLEAMASGLPVICLDYGGPGEMVTEECGVKVIPLTYEQTINDLADALLKLSKDPELRKRMGKAGRRRVMEYYTWEKKGQFIRKVYEDVLGRNIV